MSTNQLQKSSGEPPVVQMLHRMSGEIAKALPRHISPDRMARVALTALRTTPDLLHCSPASVLGAIMSAAQLGLEPNTPLGLAYLVPYGRTCQLIIGYQGYLELARRSGLVAAPVAHTVREGDEWRYALGLHPTLHHVPSDAPDRDSRPITHVYAVAHQLPVGMAAAAPPIFVVLSIAQVEARRARSKASSSKKSPWETDYEAMVLKTGIRALWRWLPKTAEMAQAAELDGVAERGGVQAAAWSSVAHEALAATGVPLELDPGPEVDETTGEVIEAKAEGSASDRLAAKLRGGS